MLKPLSEQALGYLKENRQELEDLIFTLCAIPSPSNKEQQRAAFIKKWLEQAGCQGVTIDEADNVICPCGVDDKNDLFVIMAHTDTVFPDLTPFTVRVDGDKAACPGIGDDTANVAILMLLARYIAQNNLKPRCGVMIVLNSGEEGLGNLHGSKFLTERYKDRIKEFIAADGMLQYENFKVLGGAVGSTRFKVTVKTEGGHSYGSFGNRNAIERLSAIIQRIYQIEVPRVGDSKTTYNVGVIEGGTSVNTIAQEVSMLCEFRSDNVDCLTQMRENFDRIFESARADCEELTVEIVGDRPCAKNVDPARQQAIVDKVAAAYKMGAGIEAVGVRAGSTDCNWPLYYGIPSSGVGGYYGQGAHTRGEWISLKSLVPGFQVVATLLLDYFA